MKSSETLGLLRHTIDLMERELFQYRKKSNHNGQLAALKQKRIDDLNMIYERFSSAGNLDLWIEANKTIANMKFRDPSIESVRFEFGPYRGSNHIGDHFFKCRI